MIKRKLKMHSNVSILTCMLLLNYLKTDPGARQVQVQEEKKVRRQSVLELGLKVGEGEHSIILLEQ